MRKSAEERLQAMGMFHTTAMRKRAFTSGSCGCGSRGSQQKMRKSMQPSDMREPICWSPPKGPLSNTAIFAPNYCSSILPVVPVAYNSCFSKVPLLNLTHSSKAGF